MAPLAARAAKLEHQAVVVELDGEDERRQRGALPSGAPETDLVRAVARPEEDVMTVASGGTRAARNSS